MFLSHRPQRHRNLIKARNHPKRVRHSIEPAGAAGSEPGSELFLCPWRGPRGPLFHSAGLDAYTPQLRRPAFL